MCRIYFLILIGISLQLSRTEKTTTKTCITHTKEHAICMKIVDCVGLYKILEKPAVTSEERAYLQGSRCHSAKDQVLICCSARFQAPPRDPTKLLPHLVACSDYPTRAELLYRRPKCSSKKCDQTICSGTFISKRYVLTSANCAIKNGLKSVRLLDANEHDNDDDFTKSHSNIDIEEIHVHPNYTNSSNNIGLLRLAKDDLFSIQPACLSLYNPLSYGLLFGESLITDGSFHAYCKQKSREAHDYQENSEIIEKNLILCQSNQGKREQMLQSSQLCVSAASDDTEKCRDDDGAPLLYVEKTGVHYIVGVATVSTNAADLYTHVSAYIPWILQLLRS